MLRIVKPNEATGHPDEVIDGATPVDSVETDAKGRIIEIKESTYSEPEPPKGGHLRKLSVSDLIEQCNAAISVMSSNNPHKHLLWNCAFAMRQMVDAQAKMQARLDELEVKVRLQ